LQIICKEISLPRLSRLFATALFLVFCSHLLPRAVRAQENPYIVTYDQFLEEPRNLEIEYFSTYGTQRGGNDFHAFWLEFEYGATAWWTTEFYLDAQGRTWFGTPANNKVGYFYLAGTTHAAD
jgi:hypothetical protein